MVGGGALGGATASACGGFGSADLISVASPALGGSGAFGCGAFGLTSARGSGVFSPGGGSGCFADSGTGGVLAFGSGAPIVVMISLLICGKIDAKFSLPLGPVAWSKSKKPPFATFC